MWYSGINPIVELNLDFQAEELSVTSVCETDQTKC